MASKAQTLLTSLLLLLASAVAAFDVKEILDPYPEFSTFTKYLTDNKFTDEINGRQTVTVLVVDNSAVSPLASLPAAQLKDALSVHVLLDYYDPYIFDRNTTSLVTTLFQTSGRAADGNGFLNYTKLPGERMMLGSAAPGAPHDSEILKVVGAKPYNLSVLQISKAIVPPGIGGGALQGQSITTEKAATPVPAPKASPETPAAAPPKSSGAATPAAAPPKASGATPPAKPSGAATPTAPAGAPKATADAPADGAAAPAESPADGDAAPAEGPASSSASSPAATDAPTESTSTPSGPAKSADTPASDAGEENAVSSAMRVTIGATIGTAMAVAVIALL